jgi:DNA replication protein DnaC
MLLEELADAALDGKRKEHMEMLSTVPLLIIDDLARFIREGTANGGWYHDFEAKTPVAA